MTGSYAYSRVFSVYPCRRGFAFAVLEGRDRLVDWDVAQLGIDTDDEFVRRLQSLIELYRPDLIVLEDCSTGRRTEKTRRRIEVGLGLSKYLDRQTILLSPGEMRKALDLPLRASKHDVAARLVNHFPELARKTPKRTIWQRDPRMDLFEAVAHCFAATSGAE